MNTRIKTTAEVAAVAIAVILSGGLGSPAQAGGEGKGAARLLELSSRAVAAPVAAVSEHKDMSCPKCKDVFVSVSDIDSRGLGARSLVAGGVPTRTIASHLCAGCGVEWNVTGHGKAKEAVASHKCTGCGAGSLACCSTAKGSGVATKGMEKKFEVAP